MQWFIVYFEINVAKVLCSCIGIPTIVKQEDSPQVGSLLPVGLGPISNGSNSNTRISIIN